MAGRGRCADYTKMVGNGTMDYCVFNGYANQYVENPIPSGQGARPHLRGQRRTECLVELPRGRHDLRSRHVNANPKNELFGLQSITIGPGDGACVEFTLDEPGSYPAVNHAFGHAVHGAIGVFQAE